MSNEQYYEKENQMYCIPYRGHNDFLNNFSEGRRPKIEEDQELTTFVIQKKIREAHRTETCRESGKRPTHVVISVKRCF